jgi:ABC-type Fe3+/spermidine/putrescine transport system ATPase subunit
MSKGAVSVRGLSRSFGAVAALRDVSFDVAPGEFLTLLGPSGCGKTTLLRLLAGFERADSGTIHISGQDVAPLPPHRRPVNTVFQHYALFPHRDVAGNVAFGLEMAGRPRAEARERTARALELVRLPGFGARRVDQLSGGERQRVALARALVLEPEVLLLDEPMAALDPKLRKEMQVEVKALQRRLGTTFVFVTHDQQEALAMSDRVAVMRAGRIEQLGTPRQLYDRPRTRAVADFLGVRNLLQAAVEDVSAGRARLRTAGSVTLEAAGDGYSRGARIWIGLRPERLSLQAPSAAGLGGTLEEALFLGDRVDWRVRLGQPDAPGETLTVAEPAGAAAARRCGDAVSVGVPPDAVLRLEDAGAGDP